MKAAISLYLRWSRLSVVRRHLKPRNALCKHRRWSGLSASPWSHILSYWSSKCYIMGIWRLLEFWCTKGSAGRHLSRRNMGCYLDSQIRSTHHKITKNFAYRYGEFVHGMFDVIGFEDVPLGVSHKLLGLLYDLEHLALQVTQKQVLDLVVQA